MDKKESFKQPPTVKVYDASDIGKAIRSRRKELGYTQEYLAEITGFSPRLIGEIEHGKKTVGVQKVLDLAIGLGLDLTIVARGAQ